MTTRTPRDTRFAHHRLDAYWVALELFRSVEAAAAVEMSRLIGLVADDHASSLQCLADRVAAMTLGLVRREQRRLPDGSAPRTRDVS